MSEVVFDCPDWSRRLDAGEFPLDVDRFLPHLNARRADQAVEIFSRLRLPDVPEQPCLTADVAGEWWHDIVRIVAGGLHKREGGDLDQIVKTVLIGVSKKNSKSSGSAGLMLTLLMMSPRPNSTMQIIAPTQPISDIAFSAAVGMIRADESLAGRFRVQEHLKRITFLPNRSTLSVRTFSADILTGNKSSVTLVDEGHLLNTVEHARIMTQVRGAGAAIAEQQTIIISTMSDKPANGFWKQELSLARDVRDGRAQVGGIVPLIWEPSPESMKSIDALCQPEVWQRCNPNIGRSVSMRWLKASFKETLARNDEGEVLRWLSQHTNAEVAKLVTGDADQWEGAAVWPASGDAAVRWDWIVDNCPQIAFGFDGGGAHDLTSLALIGLGAPGENGDARMTYVAVKSFCFAEAMKQDIASGVLGDAVACGDLTVVDAGEDIKQIADLICGAFDPDADPARLIGIGVDPAGIGGELADAIEARGIQRDKVIAVAQGFKLKPAWTSIYRKCRQRTLLHGDQPLVNWAINNCRVGDSGFVAKKYGSSAQKIDPAVAVAIGMMLAANPPRMVDINALICW